MQCEKEKTITDRGPRRSGREIPFKRMQYNTTPLLNTFSITLRPDIISRC